MKGIESSKQLFNNNNANMSSGNNREENKISGFEAQSGLNMSNNMNPSYFSRGGNVPVGVGVVPLSPT